MKAVKTVYIVTDLGPGDGGKGGVVHAVANKTRAHTVVKVGGAQGCHGVRTAAGESGAFNQWGCGTFEGIPTHISSRLVVAPEDLHNEADRLRYQHGVHEPFELLTVDEEALCATPFHRIASSLKELARGNDPRGTIGTGVGEAYRDARRFPELAIRVRDLSRPDLADRLAAVREQIVRDLESVVQGEFLPDDRAAVNEEIELLHDPKVLGYVTKRFREISKLAKIVDHGYLGREILSQDGAVVVESSHGILTDHYLGFHLHTSAIRTLPRFARAMIEDAGYDGKIVSLGVTRAYAIRHGAGPMPTADETMGESLLPGSHKLDNRYQGKVRVGPLDLVLLRYAIAASGGPSAYDGLAISWFDQIVQNKEWRLCHRYRSADDENFFTPSGDIKVRFGDDETQLTRQEELTRQLFDCRSEITTLKLSPSATPDELYALCADTLREHLRVPVRMISFGPTEREKMFK